MHTRVLFRLTFYVLLMTLAGGFAGCKLDGKDGIAEGIIEYDAEPVDMSNPMADLAPSKMTVRFKDNKSCVDLSAGMGLFSTTFISDPENLTMTQLIKLLNKKYVHVADTSELRQENHQGPKMFIEKTNETKMIAKYKCKKAIVRFENNARPPFDIYYTNDIAIENPNWSNPFSEIDGVLMEYQLARHGLEMRFTAKTVTPSDIDDEIFEVPEDYKKISHEELVRIFEAFQ